MSGSFSFYVDANSPLGVAQPLLMRPRIPINWLQNSSGTDALIALMKRKICNSDDFGRLAQPDSVHEDSGSEYGTSACSPVDVNGLVLG